jgi:hypothetical protein
MVSDRVLGRSDHFEARCCVAVMGLWGKSMRSHSHVRCHAKKASLLAVRAGQFSFCAGRPRRDRSLEALWDRARVRLLISDEIPIALRDRACTRTVLVELPCGISTQGNVGAAVKKNCLASHMAVPFTREPRQ